MSWNVNGLRAVVKKGFTDQIDALAPDVLGLQETKAQDDQVREALFGWDSYEGALELRSQKRLFRNGRFDEAHALEHSSRHWRGSLGPRGTGAPFGVRQLPLCHGVHSQRAQASSACPFAARGTRPSGIT